MKVPVLLVAFNRPKTTQKVLEAIAKYYPDELYFSVDGPRSNRPDDVERVALVRLLAQKGVHAKKVVRIFHESNLGCRLGGPTAITEFFYHVDHGVILEDDGVPCDDFWPFMEFPLNYFSDDPRVGSVSGNCLLTQGNCDFSFYYSRLNHIWGWGTWRRAWNSYSVSVKDDDKTIYSVLKNVFF